MSNGTEASGGLTARAVTGELFSKADTSEATVYARTPHGTHRFVIHAVERSPQGPVLVLEPLDVQSSAAPAGRTADLRDVVLSAIAANGMATVEWGEAEPLTEGVVAEREAELRRLMVERIAAGKPLDSLVAGALSDDAAASLQEHHFPPEARRLLDGDRTGR